MKPRTTPPLPALALLALGAVAAAPAAAVPNQTVFVVAPGTSGGSLQDRGPGVVSVQADYGRAPSGENPGAAVQNLATARPGAVGVRSASEGSVASGGATATTNGSFTIVGPGGSVPVSLNLALDGGLAVEGGERSPSAGASIELHYAFGGALGTYTATLSKGANLAPATLRLSGTTLDDNPFEGGEATAGGFAWNGLYTTQTVLLPVGRTLQMQLLLTARSSLGSGVSDPAAFGRAGAAFEHTLALPFGQDVFNLPAGYTVQSADFGIVDNRYTMPVPDAPSAALLAAGVLALALRRGVGRAA